MLAVCNFECNLCQAKWHVPGQSRFNIMSLLCFSCGKRDVAFTITENPPNVNIFDSTSNDRNF